MHRGIDPLCVCVCVSHSDHAVLPVVFVVRQHFSDLAQLVLQLSVGVDLDTEGCDHHHVWKWVLCKLPPAA